VRRSRRSARSPAVVRAAVAGGSGGALRAVEESWVT